MTLFRSCAWIALSSVLLSTAHAAEPATQAPAFESQCVTYDAAYAAAPLMQVQLPPDQPRVYLQTAARACPASGSCAQRAKAFLVAGDQVLVSQDKGGFRCTYYGTAGGNLIAGFLPTGSLVPVHEESALAVDFLQGRWKDGDDAVNFMPGPGGKVHGTGTAIWKGMNASDVNDGAFDAQAVVSGPEAVFKDDACEVHVRRRGNYLVLDDNRQCGGMNVAFSGIYVRAKGKVR